jgi:hypothetical protein
VISLVPFLVIRKSKTYFTTLLRVVCNCIRIVVAVITIGAAYLFYQELGTRLRAGRIGVPAGYSKGGARSFWWALPWGWCLLRRTLPSPLVSFMLGGLVAAVSFSPPNLLETFLLSMLFRGVWCNAYMYHTVH